MTSSESNQVRRAAVFDAISKSGHTLDRDAAEIRREADDLLFDISEARPPLLAGGHVDAFRLRFDGDPPNRSVTTTTPWPLSTASAASQISRCLASRS